MINGTIWVDFDDPDYYARKTVTQSKVTKQNTSATIDSVYSKIEYKYEFSDPNHTIDTITVELQTMGQEILERHTFERDALCNLSTCQIESDTFDHLAPYVLYQIVVKASGNDTIDDFENEIIDIKNVQSPPLSYWKNWIFDSYDGLYGVITGLEHDGDDLLISYYYENKGIYHDSDSGQTINLKLAAYDNNSRVAQLYDLIIGQNVLRIPLSSLESITSFAIVNEKQTENFFQISNI